MVTKRDDNRQPTTDDDRVNIEQSASGRLEGRVLQYKTIAHELFFSFGLKIFRVKVIRLVTRI